MVCEFSPFPRKNSSTFLVCVVLCCVVLCRAGCCASPSGSSKQGAAAQRSERASPELSAEQNIDALALALALTGTWTIAAQPNPTHSLN